MTIFTQLRQRETLLEEVPAPLGQSLGAQAEDAWIRSPMSSLGRMNELGQAQSGALQPIDELSQRFGFPEDVAQPTTGLLAADIARQRVKDAGLNLTIPDAGIREGALAILMERKKDEKRRQDILARGPKGFWSGAAHLGVGVGVSALDPLNVASAFIPVLGPGRYAAMLAGATGALGRAGVRAGVGAVEGAVGAAVVEPIVYAAATQEQADYTLAESLLNVALGTVMGGGLHVGFGAAGEAIARGQSWRQAGPAGGELPRILAEADLGTREAALRVAVAQAASGRAIDVDALLRLDPRVNDLMQGTSLSTRRDDGLSRYMDELNAPRPRESEAPLGAPRAPEREPSLFEFLAARGGLRADPELAAIMDGNPLIPGAGRLVRRGGKGMTLDDALRAAVEAGYIDDPGAVMGAGELQRSITDLLEKLDAEARGFKQYRAGYVPPVEERRAPVDFQDRRLHEQLERDLRETGARPSEADFADRARAVELVRKGEEKDLLAAYERAVMERPEPGAPNALDDFDLPDGLAPRPVDMSVWDRADAASRLDRAMAEISERARADFEQRLGRLADIDAVRAADERLASAKSDEVAANDDLAEVMDDLAELSRALGDEGVVARELADFDKLNETADAYGRAVRAAAECGLRRGA